MFYYNIQKSRLKINIDFIVKSPLLRTPKTRDFVRDYLGRATYIIPRYVASTTDSTVPTHKCTIYRVYLNRICWRRLRPGIRGEHDTTAWRAQKRFRFQTYLLKWNASATRAAYTCCTRVRLTVVYGILVAFDGILRRGQRFWWLLFPVRRGKRCVFVGKVCDCYENNENTHERIAWCLNV